MVLRGVYAGVMAVVVVVAAFRRIPIEKGDNVMVSSAIGIEIESKEAELNASDFGLLEDENHRIPFRGEFGIGLDSIENYLRFAFTGTHEQLMRERVQQALNSLVRHRAIYNYNSLEAENGVIRFNFQPVFPARYITVEVQL